MLYTLYTILFASFISKSWGGERLWKFYSQGIVVMLTNDKDVFYQIYTFYQTLSNSLLTKT